MRMHWYWCLPGCVGHIAAKQHKIVLSDCGIPVRQMSAVLKHGIKKYPMLLMMSHRSWQEFLRDPYQSDRALPEQLPFFNCQQQRRKGEQGN